MCSLQKSTQCVQFVCLVHAVNIEFIHQMFTFHLIWLVSLAIEVGPGLLDELARDAITFQPNRASCWTKKERLCFSLVLEELHHTDIKVLVCIVAFVI